MLRKYVEIDGSLMNVDEIKQKTESKESKQTKES